MNIWKTPGSFICLYLPPFLPDHFVNALLLFSIISYDFLLKIVTEKNIIHKLDSFFVVVFFCIFSWDINKYVKQLFQENINVFTFWRV